MNHPERLRPWQGRRPTGADLPLDLVASRYVFSSKQSFSLPKRFPIMFLNVFPDPSVSGAKHPVHGSKPVTCASVLERQLDRM